MKELVKRISFVCLLLYLLVYFRVSSTINNGFYIEYITITSNKSRGSKGDMSYNVNVEHNKKRYCVTLSKSEYELFTMKERIMMYYLDYFDYIYCSSILLRLRRQFMVVLFFFSITFIPSRYYR